MCVCVCVRASTYLQVTPAAPAEDTMDEKAVKKEAVKQETQHRTKTVITFDKGGEWSFVRAPETDVHGQPIQCADAQHCNLNLYVFFF